MSYKRPTNVLQMSYMYPAYKCPTNVLQMSYTRPTNVLQVSYKYPTNVLQASYKCPTDVPQVSYKCHSSVLHSGRRDGPKMVPRRPPREFFSEAVSVIFLWFLWEETEPSFQKLGSVLVRKKQVPKCSLYSSVAPSPPTSSLM